MPLPLCLQASPELQSYELVVVGHSLGAGIASLLALLLRPMFPKLRCFAFSPPGCVMSENAAKYGTGQREPLVQEDADGRGESDQLV